MGSGRSIPIVRILAISSVSVMVLLAGSLFIRPSKPALKQTPAPSLAREKANSKNTPPLFVKTPPKSAANRLKTASPELSPKNADLREIRERGLGREGLETETEAAGAMSYAFKKRVPEGMDSIPSERYIEAFEQMRFMPRYSTAQGEKLPSLAEVEAAGRSDDPSLQPTVGTWTQLGPGNVGGRTRALLIDSNNPSIMYAAGVAGGVWKTTNGGTSWTPKSDVIANIAVNSLAMSPSDHNVLYAGTGEGFSNIDAVRGAGIFKSIDGGNNWSLLANTATTNFNFVNDIVVSPVDDSHVYAATSQGVFRSLDAGVTWTTSLSVPSSGGCLDLAIRTDQLTDYLYTACGNFTSGNIRRNTDVGGSGTWVTVLTANPNEIPMGRISLAIAPSNQNTIYALSARFSSGTYQHSLHAVFRSTSSGDTGTWVAQVRNTDPIKLNTMLLSNPYIAFQTECGLGTSSIFGQGWYDNVIAVDPVDANRVWVGGTDLFRSDDGGVNWGLASHWWAKTATQYSHADHHALVFHPGYNGTSNKMLYDGNDGGIFRTDDARAATATGTTAPCAATNSSVTWTSLNHNYGVTQFYHGLPYPGGATYFAGAQDNGTVRGTDGGGTEGWVEINGGDGGYVAIDPGNTNVIYGENTRGSIFKSTNGGGVFADADSGLENEPGFLFIAPFTMDPSNSSRLWTGGIYIWRTVNAAGNWVRASALTVGAGNVSAVAVSPADPNIVLVGMSDGYVNRTTAALSADSNTAWSVSQPRTGTVSWLAFDPSNTQIVYATYSTFGGSHIYRSTDGGVTWNQGMDISKLTGMPDTPAHSVVVDPNSSSRLYVGTDSGVFVSLDAGATWMVENTGFANVITESLSIIPVNTVPTLFAFTHGRGAWRVPLNSLSSGARLTLMLPNRQNAGGPGFTLNVYGANFAANSVVRWNGSDRTTTFINSNRLTAAILSGDVAGAGTPSVTVFNPTGGTTSDPLTFTLDSGSNLVPSISSLSPTIVREGGGDFVLTVNGSSHSPATIVRWNGTDLPTINVSATSTMAVVPASNTASPGTGTVSLFTPVPGGGTSGTMNVTMGTPRVSVSPGSLNFGTQLQNTPSVTQNVNLTNIGTTTLSLNNINTSSSGPGVFSQTNNCGFSVAAGVTCTYTFTFTPNGIGNVSGSLSFTHNAFATLSPIVVTLAGQGVGPGVNLSQSTINYGNQNSGTTSSPTAVILNNGSASPITVNSIVVTGEFTQNNNCPVSPSTLAAAASCTINITFAPTSLGAKVGTVVVTDTGTGSPRTINLSGTSVAALAGFTGAYYSGTTLAVGGVVKGRIGPPIFVTLTNNGNINMVISNINVTVPGDYSVVHNCPGTIAAAGSCFFTVTLSPTISGAINGTITITSNAQGSPHVINVSGSGVDFLMSLSRPKRPNRANIAQGQVESFDVTISPMGGFRGSVQMSCGDVPANMRCTISPSMLNVGAGDMTATVTVSVLQKSKRLSRVLNSPTITAVLKLNATAQGVTHSIEIPITIAP